MVQDIIELTTSSAPPTGARFNEAKSVPPECIGYSDQTQWMLAVRDHQDREAFAKLFDHFAPRLKGFIMKSGIGAAQAEEIVQDVMLTVWRKAAQFDPHRAQVSAWIYQITRNRQIDITRKENRPAPEELKEDPGSASDASQVVGLEQEAGLLRQALANLKPEQREIIEKAYLGELTHQEISAEAGLLADPPYVPAPWLQCPMLSEQEHPRFLSNLT